MSTTDVSVTPQLLRFGNCELDLAAGELRRAGRQVRLAQQPLKVLALLASRPGEVVTRDELREHVWGADTHVDFERGLNFCVLQIRRALADDSRAPRFIETLPRRGYRFLGPVEAVATAGAAGVAQPPARPFPWLAVALLVLLVAVGSGIFLAAYRASNAASDRRVMLAVLPFKNLSGDPAQEYFSDGLTEELIAQLGGLDPHRLGVIARTSSERYKASTPGVAEVGAELGVAYLLEGSVRRDPEQVRITAQLIRVSDQTQLWTESYDRNQWGALVIQRDVAAAVASALQLALLRGDTLPDRAGGHVPAAHDAYLEGRFLQAHGKPADLERSVEVFARSIALDPGFALPRAALAESYHRLAMADALPPTAAYPLARDAAAGALVLSESLAEAQLAVGRVAFWHDWDAPEAERRFRRALELNPSLADAQHDLGWLLIATGRTADGLAHLARARELDPLSSATNVDAGWALIQTRRFAAAVEQCERTRALDPGLEEAARCSERARLLRDRAPAALAALRRRVDEELRDGESATPHRLAVDLALLGDADQALAWLERAYVQRSPSLTLLAVEPAFDSLRSDPRFLDLVRRVGVQSAG